MESATTAYSNVAVGSGAGKNITDGSSNITLGSNAGTGLTTGSNNVAIGTDCLNTTNTGHWNIAIGNEALKSSTVSYNIGIGYKAGMDITNGAENILIGKSAGENMTEGESNLCIGKEAGNNITTGSYNTVIGENATASAADVDNEFTLGDTGVTSFRIPGLQSGATDGQVLTYNSSNGNIDLSSAGTRAWVNFDGTGTVSRRDNYNVDSITDINTGKYQVNFTNDMSNNNYAFSGSVATVADDSNPNYCFPYEYSTGYTTSMVRVKTGYQSGSESNTADRNCITVAVFGD